jgi:dihydroorotate dehydrogenase electron transfer subunit
MRENIGKQMAKKFEEYTTVVENTQIANDIFDLRLKTENIAGAAVPGQFVSIYCNDGGRLLPRPISICEADRENGILRLVYRIEGEGTREFSRLQNGDTIRILGPLGNGFPLLKKKAFLIGGGIGIPPILELAKNLDCDKNIVLGYRNSDLFLYDDLKKYGDVYIATEDGSEGTKGNVLDAIRENALTADVIYACGPVPMLRALKQYAAENNIECYLSLEERMACGIGACLACVCNSTGKDEHLNINKKRVCKEGPVFRAEDIT